MFKKLFSSSKTVDDVFDKDSGLLVKVGGWIGNQQFTTEEQHEANQKLVDSVQKFAVDTLSENTERSKTRREIAVLVIQTFVLLLFMSAIVFPFNPQWSRYLFELTTSASLTSLVLGVGAFFFGVHVLRASKK